MEMEILESTRDVVGPQLFVRDRGLRGGRWRRGEVSREGRRMLFGRGWEGWRSLLFRCGRGRADEGDGERDGERARGEGVVVGEGRVEGGVEIETGWCSVSFGREGAFGELLEEVRFGTIGGREGMMDVSDGAGTVVVVDWVEVNDWSENRGADGFFRRERGGGGEEEGRVVVLGDGRGLASEKASEGRRNSASSARERTRRRGVRDAVASRGGELSPRGLPFRSG